MKLLLLFNELVSLPGMSPGFDNSWKQTAPSASAVKQILPHLLQQRAAEAKSDEVAVPVSCKCNPHKSLPFTFPHPFYWQNTTIWKEMGIKM